MNSQQKAKIFLADERSCDEKDPYRTYSTFNVRNSYNENKKSFGGLYLLNDDTIAGNSSMNLSVEKESYVVLLPVVGTVLCKINSVVDAIVNAGQLQVFKLHSNTSVEFLNCYENQLINFIQVWIDADNSSPGNLNELFTFYLDENRNKLININETKVSGLKNPVISIGKFTGRNEAVYKTKSSLFVFVIEGVFEVQGRLLHTRDGLALWNEAGEIEFEALSNDAIIFLIECNN